MNNLSNLPEIELQFKPYFKLSERPLILNSKDAHQVLKNSWDDGKLQLLEEFKIILLNNANRVMGIAPISQGGRDNVSVDIAIVFSIALKACASKIILAHNHPSGKLIPSPADKSLTAKVSDAGRLLNINICDHLILSSDNYYSFADNGEISLNNHE